MGTDPDMAMTGKLDELMDRDEEVGIEDVQEAYAESTSLMYAYDLSSFQLVVDFLSKLLLGTAVFSDLVLRAALSAWKNAGALGSRAGASTYDASAAALEAVLAPAPTPTTP